MIHARTGVATVLCLGADAVLSLTPNSGLEIRETPAVRLFTGADDMSVDLRQDEENHESLSPTVGQSSAAEAKEKTKTVCNNSKDPFVVTMVHGDVLVFVGDDFKVLNNLPPPSPSLTIWKSRSISNARAPRFVSTYMHWHAI